MKTSYRIKIGITIALLIVFFLILNLTFLNKEVKNFFYKISPPIQKTLWRAGDRVSDFFEGISKSVELKKELEKFQLQNQEFLQKIVALNDLEKENKILREALDIGLEKEFKLKIAQVIGKDISQDSILINKGSKDGILKDLPVITQQKILIGKISEVFENFSRVMLLSNKNSSLDAKISDTRALAKGEDERSSSTSEAYGVVKGKGNLKLYLDIVPKDKEIKEGEILVTAALGGFFPKGLLIGKIKEVQKSDVEPFQKAEIESVSDIKELETLFIIEEW